MSTVADVLKQLVAQTTFSRESVDNTYAQLDAFAAIDAWAGSASPSLPEGAVVDRPAETVTLPQVSGGIDYQKLAEAIVSAQEAAGVVTEPVPAVPVSPLVSPVVTTPIGPAGTQTSTDVTGTTTSSTPPSAA